jgi:4-carboxymuconolactone decarboxylase
MPRIKLPSPAEMTEAQRAVHDAIVAGPRGRAPAPLLVWLTSPELASRAERLGAFVRYESTLAPRLREFAILLVAHFWTSSYEWAAHEPEALAAGLDPALIDDIVHRRPPRFQTDDERAVYEFVGALQEAHDVPGPVYTAAIQALGERATVELVGIVGYYTLIAMTLTAFDIAAPNGMRRGPAS